MARLFVEVAATRGKARALGVFRAHGVHVLTFPQHLPHGFQAVDGAASLPAAPQAFQGNGGDRLVRGHSDLLEAHPPWNLA
jgi:hypothetical protein